MAGSLLAGVLFALGHHLFYASLSGTTVESWNLNIWGFGITQQQVNTSAGTSLAFLAKVFFVLAISVAYTQAFWRAVRNQSTPVKVLDTITSLLDNILAFLQVSTWARYPLLLVLALSVWLVPIASVITPATLSVIVAPVSPPVNATMHVPQADYTSLKFTTPGGWELSMAYRGPSLEVNRLAQASAFSGSVLPITPPASNATWQTNFYGPYLKCSNVSDPFRRQVQESTFLTFVNQSGCNTPMNYLSWTSNTGIPVISTSQTTYVPTSANPVPFWPMSPYTANSGTLGPYNIDNGTLVNATDPATIYFAVNSDTQVQQRSTCQNWNREKMPDDWSTWWSDTPMLQCQLHNATYQTSFNFTNGAQSIKTSFPNLDQAAPLPPVWDFYFDDTECAALNRNISNGESEHISAHSPNCTIDPGLLQQLSFQAVMDAFGKIMVGTISQGQSGGSKYGGSDVMYTSVQSTQLLKTRELAFMGDRASWLVYQNYSAHWNTSNADLQSLWDWQTTSGSDRSLAETIEEVFQNITISMMSSPGLQPNASSSFHIDPVVVTFHDYQTVYAYAAATLWLAYGLAIGVTLIGVVVGLTCMFINGAAFSDDFSTIMRATRNADVSVEIKEQDSDGKAPLPKYIGQATVAFVGGALRTGVEEVHVQPKTPLLGRRGD